MRYLAAIVQVEQKNKKTIEVGKNYLCSSLLHVVLGYFTEDNNAKRFRVHDNDLNFPQYDYI